MFHSDRGVQYTSFAFHQLLDSLNVVQSFSKKGYPFDNAVCESFFKYLKLEETNRKTYHTFDELHWSIFEYIEGFYNSRRPHASLGYLTPNEMESTIGNRFNSVLNKKIYKNVSTLLTIVHVSPEKVSCPIPAACSGVSTLTRSGHGVQKPSHGALPQPGYSFSDGHSVFKGLVHR